jgi:hypothetical protein
MTHTLPHSSTHEYATIEHLEADFCVHSWDLLCVVIMVDKKGKFPSAK